MRRQIMKMSQEVLGDMLGISFQQVQKYEKGMNRVSASRLWEMSKALKVPVQYFYEGLQYDGKLKTIDAKSDATGILIEEFIDSHDGIKFLTSVSGIKDKAIRQQVLDLVRALSL